MNLDKFKDQVSRQGLARSNRWVARIYPPSGLTASGTALSNALSQGGNKINLNLPGLDLADQAQQVLRNLNIDLGPIQVQNNFAIPTLGYVLTNMGSKLEALNLFTAACSLPSRDIQNVEFREYGEARYLGVQHTHSDFTITYYCSEDLRERKFFEQWQDLIFNPRTKKHAFYKDYISRMEVIKYDASWQNIQAVYRFNEVYPTNIAAMELDQNEQSVLQLQVTFKYRNYEIIGPEDIKNLFNDVKNIIRR